MKKILIVGGFSEIHKVLKKEGFGLTLVTESSKIKPYFNSLYNEVFAFENFNNLEKITETMKSFIKQNKHDYISIICMFDELQYIAATLSSAIGISYNLNMSQVKLINNKNLLRVFLNEHNLDPTPSCVVEKVSDIFDFVSKHGDSILKPIDGSSSKSIYKINGKNQTEVENILNNNLDTTFIIEKFIYGEEFSVEAISIENKHFIYGITKKIKNEKTFVETGHIVPANLSNNDEKTIKKFVEELLKTLEISNGPTHTEIILSEDGKVYLVETHARLGGDFISELYKLSYKDFNPIRVSALSSAMILSEFPSIRECENYTAIYFEEFLGKKIKLISTNDEVAKSNIELIESRTYVKPGDLSREISSMNRVGHVIIKDKSYKNLLENRENTLNEIFNVEYE